MNIQDLKVGSELDALVAERVIGWTICEHSRKGIPTAQSSGRAMCSKQDCKGELHYDFLDKYSIDISAAWKIVEFLRKEGCDFDSFSSATRLQPGWSDVVFMSQVDEFSARAETLPLAICRAALLTVEKIR